MVETRVWKKVRAMTEIDSLRLNGEVSGRENLLSGCKKLVATEYVQRHDNVLKILVVECGKKALRFKGNGKNIT